MEIQKPSKGFGYKSDNLFFENYVLLNGITMEADKDKLHITKFVLIRRSQK